LNLPQLYFIYVTELYLKRNNNHIHDNEMVSIIIHAFDI